MTLSPMLKFTFLARRSQVDLVQVQDGMGHQVYILISQTLASEMSKFSNVAIPSLYIALVLGRFLLGKVNGMAAMVLSGSLSLCKGCKCRS